MVRFQGARNTVRPLLNILRVVFGLFLTIALSASWCAAQDGYGGIPPASGNINANNPMTPGPPSRIPPVSRPSTWPGQASPWSPSQAPTDGQLPSGPIQACAGSRIIAHVGTEVILESDLIVRKIDKRGGLEVVGGVDHILSPYKDRMSPEQFAAQREMLLQKLLPEVVQVKLICLDAKRTIPAEGWPQIKEQLSKAFDDFQLDKLMKQFEVDSPIALEAKLDEVGTSVDRERRAFIDFNLARQWQMQQVGMDDEITYDHMMSYYQKHLDEFTTPARARWEELMVSFSKHPNQAAAGEAIARMGNQVLAGVPFAEVARQGSDAVEAAQGGRRDWTPKGNLACKELDRALFSLPIGQLSPIIEGPTGFHIIRVVERQDVTVAEFLDAQVSIREKIIQDRRMKQLKDFFAKLKARTPVKTIFDEAEVADRPDHTGAVR